MSLRLDLQEGGDKMNELDYPYNMVRDNLDAALAKLRNLPYDNVMDQRLISMLKEADSFLENKFFGCTVIHDSYLSGY